MLRPQELLCLKSDSKCLETSRNVISLWTKNHADPVSSNVFPGIKHEFKFMFLINILYLICFIVWTIQVYNIDKIDEFGMRQPNIDNNSFIIFPGLNPWAFAPIWITVEKVFFLSLHLNNDTFLLCLWGRPEAGGRWALPLQGKADGDLFLVDWNPKMRIVGHPREEADSA